ncbi:pilus assembly protein, partial [Mesorhizobium sp. M4A.F.Ca.ET.020.02.1.1]|uniref:TadE/TadG family type IV pilus assembly protein n=1 Tax=Mesorhizobium sp. M4A.F.Ca.ET.020.02.1.1 TaxID=2496652 RepID=UPI000FD31C88
MLQDPKSHVSWSRFRADAVGTTAVEFAMLAPLFILLLLGMVAYGIYFGASHSVQQIAADAARTAIAGLNQT